MGKIKVELKNGRIPEKIWRKMGPAQRRHTREQIRQFYRQKQRDILNERAPLPMMAATGAKPPRETRLPDGSVRREFFLADGTLARAVTVSPLAIVTDTFLLEVTNGDTFSGNFSGMTSTLCGGAALAGQINACSVPDHPFADCAANPQDLCCRTSDSMTAIGEAETAGGACIGLPDCGATSSILTLAGGSLQCNEPTGPIIFDGPHYIGNWPFTGFIPTAERLAVWCDNGTVDIAILDADNCEVSPEPSHSVTWDPNTLTGTVTFPGQVGTCCFQNEATTEMRIQLKLD